MLSQKTRYGLKAMIYLAKKYPDHRYVIVSELSKTVYIPQKFLEKILLLLKSHNYVESRIGRMGGYRLGMAPEKIILKDVLICLGEKTVRLSCLKPQNSSKCPDCESVDNCEVQKVMSKVYGAIFEMFESISLYHFLIGDSENSAHIALKLQDALRE